MIKRNELPDKITEDYFTLEGTPVTRKIVMVDELEYEVSFSSKSNMASVGCATENIESITEAKIKSHIQIGTSMIPVIVVQMGAFRGCKNLQTVDIQNGIEKIYAGAFADCISLEEVYLPDSLEYLGFGVFSGCINLKKVSLPDTCVINGDPFAGCNLGHLSIEKRTTEPN